MHRSLVFVAALIALLAGSLGSVAAQEATPSVPGSPLAAACTVPPRTPAEIADVYVAYYPEGSTVPAPTPIPDVEALVLAGEPADEATVAAIRAAMTEAGACGTEHGFLGFLAFVTDECIARCFYPDPGPAPSRAEIEELFAGFAQEEPATEDAEAGPGGPVLLANLLPDGRVGVLAVEDDPSIAELTGGQTRVLNYTVWEQVGGSWRLDLFVEDPFDLVPGYGNDLDEPPATPEATPAA